MTAEDTKIIFGNIPELAVLSDNFSERLEAALGSIIQEGQAHDHVGKLFLEMVRLRVPLYVPSLV